MFKRLLCVLSALLLCCVGSLTVRASDIAEEFVTPDGVLRVNGEEYLISTTISTWASVNPTKTIYGFVYNMDGKTYTSETSGYFPCDTPYQNTEHKGFQYIYLPDDAVLSKDDRYTITWDIGTIGVSNFNVEGVYLFNYEMDVHSEYYTEYEVLAENTSGSDDSFTRIKLRDVTCPDDVYVVFIEYTFKPTTAHWCIYTRDCDIDEEDTGGLLNGIIEWLKGIYDSIKELPTKIADKVTDGIKSLFVPTQENFESYFNKWELLLEDRFGAIYQVVQILRDMFNSIIDAASGEPQSTIEMPVVELEFGETVFEFGGWEVEIVPDGFDFLVDALKFALDCVCTVSFIGALRKKYDDLMEDG